MRSGVYMVLSLIESVIRFGFVGVERDAHFWGCEEVIFSGECAGKTIMYSQD